MVALNDIKARRDEILRICESHGGHNVRVFGSVAKGQTSPQSDLDLLVELDDDRSLLDRIAIMQDLEEFLGCRVDVVSPRALHSLIRDEVLREAVDL